MKKHKKKYISVKLPACGKAYPIDRQGCRKLPNYTSEYLRKHGKKLFNILLHQVPSLVYQELVKQIREKENI